MMFADPLLQQASMVATMFVITNAASEPGVYYAGWDDIQGIDRAAGRGASAEPCAASG